MPGMSTVPVEITTISQYGFWVLLDKEELFLPFEHFRWFRSATIEKFIGVERPTADHLCWPLLGIDLSIQSI